MSTKAMAIINCKKCGSSDLYWFTSMRNTGQAQDGRLCMHEVTCDFVLGCNHCSETLAVVAADNLAEQMTQAQGNTAEAVYANLSRQATQRTSMENVEDVLTALEVIHS